VYIRSRATDWALTFMTEMWRFRESEESTHEAR